VSERWSERKRERVGGVCVGGERERDGAACVELFD
jgi:hypothetical protein